MLRPPSHGDGLMGARDNVLDEMQTALHVPSGRHTRNFPGRQTHEASESQLDGNTLKYTQRCTSIVIVLAWTASQIRSCFTQPLIPASCLVSRKPMKRKSVSLSRTRPVKRRRALLSLSKESVLMEVFCPRREPEQTAGIDDLAALWHTLRSSE